MDEKSIHVLPVGFDIHRLTAPLTSGAFDVDQVILLHSTEDVVQEGDQTATDELVSNALHTTKNNIENYVGVPVETRTIPPLDDYRQLYGHAYELLLELSNQGIVHVNVSSLPLSAASAFINAEAVLSAEGTREQANSSNETIEFPDEYTDRSDRLHTYYIRPDQYVEAELVEYISDTLPSAVSTLDDRIEEYKEIESGLFYGLAKPIHRRIDLLSDLIDEAEDQLTGAPSEQRSADWDTHIRQCHELLEEFANIGPDEPFAGPIWRQREEDSEIKDGYTAIENPYISPDRFQSKFNTALDHADDGALSDDLHTEIQTTLDEVHHAIEIYWKVWDWSDQFVLHSEDILDELQPTRLIETTNEHGMTRGIKSINGEQYLSLPHPPIHDLRQMEELILAALDQAKKPKAIGELAAILAGQLRKNIERYIQNVDKPIKEIDRFWVRTAAWDYKDGRLDQTEEHIQAKLRSRIQYNLGSLDEKQYIVRTKDPDDKRRTVIELTTTGKLWAETHSDSEDYQDLIESFLDQEGDTLLSVEKE